jgi:uncharacterized protein with ATP-grasp and redox domains
MTTRPPMIQTNETNAFAYHTIRVRVPAILRETQALNPHFSASINSALDRLHDDLVEDRPVRLIDLPAPDYPGWLAAHEAHKGQTWQNTEWFYAETYFYRLLMEAVRWWEFGADPFTPKKDEEYAGAAHWELLEKALTIQGSAEERLAEGLGAALWGNRIDLSYALSASHGSDVQADDLLVDERPQIVRHLLSGRGAVDIITDNAGSELTMDLILADILLDTCADSVTLHVKMHPTFVSDVIPVDVVAFLQRAQAETYSADTRAFARRLWEALQSGRLRVVPDVYWNSSVLLWEMPPHLRQTFAKNHLAIIKGDANYRRTVGDRIWDPTTPFAAVVNNFPCPLVALRTLKSDPVIGLAPGTAERLESQDAQWRVNGRRGVIQSTLGQEN